MMTAVKLKATESDRIDADAEKRRRAESEPSMYNETQKRVSARRSAEEGTGARELSLVAASQCASAAVVKSTTATAEQRSITALPKASALVAALSAASTAQAASFV